MRVEAFIDRYRGDLFLFNERFPGGFTPRFGADIRDMSLVGGLRGERDNGLKWDASVSAARSTIEFFHLQHHQRLTGASDADLFPAARLHPDRGSGQPRCGSPLRRTRAGDVATAR